MNLFTHGVNTKVSPYTRLWSNEITTANAAQLQQQGGVNLQNALGGPAAFLSLSSTVNGTLYLTKASEPNNEIMIRQPVVANVNIRVIDEDIIKFRVEPIAYPMILRYTASRQGA